MAASLSKKLLFITDEDHHRKPQLGAMLRLTEWWGGQPQ